MKSSLEKILNCAFRYRIQEKKLDFSYDEYLKFIKCSLNNLGEVYIVFQPNGVALYKILDDNRPYLILVVVFNMVYFYNIPNNDVVKALKDFNCDIEEVKKKRHSRIKYKNKKYFQRNDEHCKTIEECPIVVLEILSFFIENIKKG